MKSDVREQQLEQLDRTFYDVWRHFIHQLLADVDDPISPKQFIMLRALYGKERCTVSDLAADLGLSASATTISLNRLVKCGLVERVRCEDDRRVVWVALSPDAVPKIQAYLERRRILLAKMTECFSDEELSQFHALLSKIRSTIGE
ncbi:MarR family transcriptional regulator [Brevibacillus sp. SYP-B805]|uniref:MarR family winged helix-turn-helix transcriptional regulator n=1 Tax=Brevibacillus sp. SYP-B805 TaxID=1578199 RepID=UPI0013EB6E36|nr:MarR family transcriptional regulator [Brevibacillus sp. SYP-B805]NGQ96367.1 MarR family transcriptional regulator [Brevibacillus sp. SYP-B805]